MKMYFQLGNDICFFNKISLAKTERMDSFTQQTFLGIYYVPGTNLAAREQNKRGKNLWSYGAHLQYWGITSK